MKTPMRTIAVVLVTFMLVVFKYIQGFENTACLIAAWVIVELWSLNGKSKPLTPKRDD